MFSLTDNRSDSRSSVEELLKNAIGELQAAGVDTPVLDAEILASRATGLSRTTLLAHPEFVPSAEAARLFVGWVERRRNREPLAYILGEREFYGITFEVNESVLIPRQETETLVDVGLRALSGVSHPRVADIGVGSGAVAVAIAANKPDAEVFCTDVSQEAVEVAGRNSRRTGVGDRVHVLCGHLFQPLSGMMFHLVVSNPPYIPTDQIPSLQPEVARYEPREALDGGPDGLKWYGHIAADVGKYLFPGGVVAVEVGSGQADAVEQIFRDHGLLEIRSTCDLSGSRRVVSARNGE